ncbi:hypothetical protein AgCh_034424 [Apium graveolens]
MSDFMLLNSKSWDVDKVKKKFTEVDVVAVLATRIPQDDVIDRSAWTKTTNGLYNVKNGHHLCWLIQKIGTASVDEIVLISKVLWGIWFFRNKKVREQRKVNHVIAMDWVNKYLQDWTAARVNRANLQVTNFNVVTASLHRWQSIMFGCFKFNVDVSFNANYSWFSVGFIFRDHLGAFLQGNVARYPIVTSVFEAEAMTIAEGLRWLFSLPYKDVTIESDLLLCVQAIRGCSTNVFKVGDVLDKCLFYGLDRLFFITLVRWQANKVAYEFTHFPYL